MRENIENAWDSAGRDEVHRADVAARDGACDEPREGRVLNGLVVSVARRTGDLGWSISPYGRLANQSNVGVCWNSNPSDVVGGSIKSNFDLVKNKLGRTAHINELYSGYPYRELFSLLRSAGFEGYCLAECQSTSDPLHVMRYYRALWRELSRSNDKTA